MVYRPIYSTAWTDVLHTRAYSILALCMHIHTHTHARPMHAHVHAFMYMHVAADDRDAWLEEMHCPMLSSAWKGLRSICSEITAQCIKNSRFTKNVYAFSEKCMHVHAKKRMNIHNDIFTVSLRLAKLVYHDSFRWV